MTRYSAQQIISLVNSGKGPTDMYTGSQTASDLSKTHDDIANEMKSLQQDMSAYWKGDAAGQAYAGAGPLVQASEVSGQHLQAVQGLYMGQGSSFGDLKGKVAAVGDLGNKPSDDLVSGTPFSFLSNRSDEIKQWNEKAQQVVDGYNAYYDQSTDNSVQWPEQYGELGTPTGSNVIKIVAPGGGPGGGGGGGDTAAPGGGDPGSGGSGGGYGGGSGSGSGSGGSGGGNGGSGSGSGSGSGGGSGSTGGSGHGGTPGSGGTLPTSGPGGHGGVQGSGSASDPGHTSTSGYEPPPPPPTGGGTGIGGGYTYTLPPTGGLGGGTGTDNGFGTGGGFAGSLGVGGGSSSGGGFGSGSGSGYSGSGSAGPGLGSAARGLGAGNASGGASGAGGESAGGRPGGGSAASGRPGTSGANGGPMGRGAKGEGDEDTEHQRPAWLLENDPDEALIGELPATSPPVIGL